MQEELERFKKELAAAQQALHAAKRSVLPPSPSTAHTFNPVYATETLEQQVGRCSTSQQLSTACKRCSALWPILGARHAQTPSDSCVAWYWLARFCTILLVMFCAITGWAAAATVAGREAT